MSDESRKQAPGTSPALAKGTEVADRRLVYRHPFTAAAEVLEPNTEVRLSARTADLGLGGCYVDTMNPFTEGTQVELKIFKGKETFEILARVGYSHAGLGMGLVFGDLSPKQLAQLEVWIAEAENVDAADGTMAETKGSSPAGGLERSPLTSLIQLLVNKKVLTEREAAKLLRDPDASLRRH